MSDGDKLCKEKNKAVEGGGAQVCEQGGERNGARCGFK